ncbi:MAG: hypothetical protein IID36_01780 [Planctomycetes bacterium]|nr:hypothetical protein [Planctomycetota bacterium]
MGEIVTRRWYAVGFVLAVNVFFAWSVGPDLYHDGTRSVHVFVGADLRALLRAWEIQQRERPGEGGFDLDAAMSNLEPRLGKDVLIRRRLAVIRAYYAKWVVLPSLLYALVLAAAHWRRNYIRARLWSGISLLLLATWTVFTTQVHRARSIPASYAYLSDFVVLAGASATASPKEATVVAYEKTPFPTGYQYVAFADGTVRAYKAAQVQDLVISEPNSRVGD